ncbi:hypothetical protein ACFVHW_08865 [Streptomyces sp. NPDC127110]|uniref:hypothetical protein n=1 Tax=Streptomyces sp. NPDC127110 TaxID=3345362 RepID=UPI003634FFA2
MEEIAYVATKIVKGAAGLAYMIGETLLGTGAADGPVQSGKKKDGEKDEER